VVSHQVSGEHISVSDQLQLACEKTKCHLPGKLCLFHQQLCAVVIILFFVVGTVTTTTNITIMSNSPLLLSL
jgi:hypothetical protein